MINGFYDALFAAESWFFGSALMNDTFFKGILDLFNSGILVSMFFGVIIWPMRWCITSLYNFFKGV